jgi:penicillin amidase
MSPAVTKRLRLLAAVVSLLLLAAAGLAGWFYLKLRGSLPALDGTASIAGLSAPVSVERDALGVPTLRGATRPDLARALGYLHAQDRFFQMDTMRRRAAGELSEIAGKGTLPIDRAARVHGFRKLAQAVLARLPADERALLDAYAEGVNAGLHSLRAKPFEYFALRVEPAPWLPEDCLLVHYAMTLDLQESTGRYEHSLMTLRDTYGPAALAFFAPLLTPDDAALDGSQAALPPIPSERAIDLRHPRTAAQTVPPAAIVKTEDEPQDAVVGSNSFAIAGDRTATGSAVLANDMHLELRVPNTWYRASLEWPGHRVTGATLPGVPVIVVGSNGHIAWGLTNAYIDTSDLVLVPVNVTAHSLYIREGELVPFEKRHETIAVKGQAPVEMESSWTVWGPVVGTDDGQRPLALHWTAYEPEATNLRLKDLETATTIEDALTVAHEAGVPTLNFIVAGADGRVAWSIAGKIPERVGFDGRLPVTWSYGDRGWRGMLPPEKVPAVIRDQGQVWSGNNRPLGGAGLGLLGDGAYDNFARAAQIRDDLARITGPAMPADLLAVQLDDRAVFLERWQKLLLATLTPEAIAQKKTRAEFRALAEKWDGHASIDSVSYRLVRSWRNAVSALAFEAIFEPCRDSYEQFDWSQFHYEGPLWTLLHERPKHLLNPRFATWDELLLAAVDRVTAQLDREGVPLSRATWGQRNTTRIRHPLSGALPEFLARWINLPRHALPGDSNMPRVQGPSFGASERFAVMPGHEAEGIFHMPGGQSGHPLSPFFSAGHAAWEKGEPTPFLPGKTEHTLTLKPQER